MARLKIRNKCKAQISVAYCDGALNITFCHLPLTVHNDFDTGMISNVAEEFIVTAHRGAYYQGSHYASPQGRWTVIRSKSS